MEANFTMANDDPIGKEIFSNVVVAEKVGLGSRTNNFARPLKYQKYNDVIDV